LPARVRTAARAPRANILWSCLAGLLWYLQFIFYGMGHNRMDTLGVASWPLHMIMLILFSTLVAIVRREWSGCSQSTRRFISSPFPSCPGRARHRLRQSPESAPATTIEHP
jgi:hypothetical protein